MKKIIWGWNDKHMFPRPLSAYGCGFRPDAKEVGRDLDREARSKPPAFPVRFAGEDDGDYRERWWAWRERKWDWDEKN